MGDFGLVLLDSFTSELLLATEELASTVVGLEADASVAGALLSVGVGVVSGRAGCDVVRPRKTNTGCLLGSEEERVTSGMEMLGVVRGSSSRASCMGLLIGDGFAGAGWKTDWTF